MEPDDEPGHDNSSDNRNETCGAISSESTPEASSENSKPGRKPILDEAKRSDIWAILASGGTRTLAARSSSRRPRGGAAGAVCAQAEPGHKAKMRLAASPARSRWPTSTSRCAN